VAHLLHVDSSIRGDASVSRKLSARAAAVWHAAHPGGIVTYRDLGRDPLPRLDAAGGLARILPRDQHTAAQAESRALTEELVGEVKAADTSGEDDDTGYGYYDAPSGNIWRPGAEPGQPPAPSPGGRAAPRPRSGGRRATGRVAALVPFPDRPHVASPPRSRIRMP
jgi:hypothetical protein